MERYTAMDSIPIARSINPEKRTTSINQLESNLPNKCIVFNRGSQKLRLRYPIVFGLPSSALLLSSRQILHKHPRNMIWPLFLDRHAGVDNLPSEQIRSKADEILGYVPSHSLAPHAWLCRKPSHPPLGINPEYTL
jgi:hypothetical protein